MVAATAFLAPSSDSHGPGQPRGQFHVLPAEQEKPRNIVERISI